MNFGSFSHALQSSIQAVGDYRAELDAAAEMVSKSGTWICATGVGKSAFIAEKFVASLRSIGVPACFLNATDLVHGDAGQIPVGGTAVLVSKSGNSSELLSVLPLFKGRNCRLIGITNEAGSRMATQCELVLPLCVKGEGDPLNLMPLVSCQVSLFICDYIAAKVQELRQLTAEQYAVNHPGGQLGFITGSRVSDLTAWKDRRPFIDVQAPLLEVVLRASEHKTGLSCIVDSGNRLVGVVTDGDVRRAWTKGHDLSKLDACEVANLDPVTVNPDWLVVQAVRAMESRPSPVLAAPVVAADRVCLGVVTLHDFVLQAAQ
jgi:arabinose-5-phosphate isomerase